MDIASGDSAVFNIGYQAASRARIEDYVTCVRDLLDHGTASYQDRPQRVRWAATAVCSRIPSRSVLKDPRCYTWVAGMEALGLTDYALKRYALGRQSQ